MLRSLRITAILGLCALAFGLVACVAHATIPGAPSWASKYQLVFSQDYTAMTQLSQVGISSGTTIGSGQTWIPTRIPTDLNWAPFIAPNGNNDPFGIDSGYLDIRAQQNQSTGNGFDGYSCGLLESMDGSGDGFAQEYGYFECSMKTPGGANTWPGFWLVDEYGLTGKTSDSVEFDISESYGNWGTGPGQNPPGQPDWDAVTWHWWNNSNDPFNGSYTQESGMTTGYNTYGADVEPSGITFYYDRKPIWSVPAGELPSPNMLDRPFYLLADLALGGGNYNNSTDTGYDYSLTPNPSDLKIKYIAVWASPASPNYSGAPAAPTNLTAVPGSQQVALYWAASTGAASYNVYRGTSSGHESGTPIATGITGTSYSNTGLANGTTYYYKVKAVDSQGTSSASSEASATPQSGEPNITNGTYYLVSDCSALGLDDPSGGGSGTGLDQQPYTSADQQWVVTSVGAGEYEIASAVNGLAATGATSEAQLTLAPYTGAPDQLWSFVANGSHYNIVNDSTGQLMNDFYNSTSAGTPIGQWPESDNGTDPNELWSFVSISGGSIANGTYYLVSDCSALGLDDPSGGGSGTGLDQQPYTSADQQWVVTSVGAGEYEIASAVNGLAATGATSEAQLTLAPYTGAPDQLWSFVANGSYYNIVNDSTGQLMNDFYNSTSAGTAIGQWPSSDNGTDANELWSLVLVYAG